MPKSLRRYKIERAIRPDAHTTTTGSAKAKVTSSLSMGQLDSSTHKIAQTATM